MKWNEILNEHRQMVDVLAKLEADLNRATVSLVEAIKQGHKVLVFGNGGSAADAQHFAAELTGRYKRERRGLPAIALSTDTSALTAIGNDYGFDNVFSRQVEALAHKGDVLIGISTSGNSENVVKALTLGKAMGCLTMSLTGKEGGVIKLISDISLNIAVENTPRVQEGHITIIHTLCEWVEEAFCG